MSIQSRSALAICLLPEGTTTQTRLTISGVASFSLVRFKSRPMPRIPRLIFRGNQGFTLRLLLASEDSTLPEAYNLGLVRPKSGCRTCPSVPLSSWTYTVTHRSTLC